MSVLVEMFTSPTFMITLIAAGALIPMSSIIFDDSGKRRNKAKTKFLELLQGNLGKGSVLDLELIGHIKQSVEREFSTELVISNTLQDILVSINDPKNEQALEQIDTLNKSIKQLILDENEAAPFENLPEEERRLLRGLEDSIKNSDSSSIKFHFDELNTVLSIRHVEHSRAIKMNRWSVPLAFVGLALTVIFGIVGMQGIEDEEMKSIIQETIQTEISTANKSLQRNADASVE